jgi:hypothetical protein
VTGVLKLDIFDDLIFRLIDDNGDNITGYDIDCELFELEVRLWRRAMLAEQRPVEIDAQVLL